MKWKLPEGWKTPDWTDWKEKLTAFLGRYKYVGLVLLAGLLLLLWPSGKQKPPDAAQPSPAPVGSTEEDFSVAALEEKLAQTLSKVQGAGEVSVMLTVQNGPQKRLAEDRDPGEDGERTETVVLSKGSSQQETVTVQEMFPRFQGAVLVCPGGDDPEVRLKLTEATAALTGLGSDKISISKGK